MPDVHHDRRRVGGDPPSRVRVARHQREFVWSRDKITRLYDSLMRGYLIGSFLMWQVHEGNSGRFAFYDFMRDHHERDNAHFQEFYEARRARMRQRLGDLLGAAAVMEQAVVTLVPDDEPDPGDEGL
ncbi:DUF262 domain-containing protein [Streptomyces sp. NPDC101166]|uniref:DUF262 domain-containing protein n=1 Tax=Streptomyces sp. NPDC101166 TaxID=3366120 RepID=UPI00381BD56D